jgi:hypothetical protein
MGPQNHQRLYVIDYYLAHMSEENTKLLGLWWSRKRRRMQAKYDEACADLEACGVDMDVLRDQWHRQVQNVTKKAPSVCSQVYLECDGAYFISGASKAEASKAAHRIIAMEDSLEKTKRLIKLATNQLLREGPLDGIDASLSLEDLQETAEQLKKKMQSSLMKLTGKDSATAAALKKAIKDEFLGLRLKGRALLIRIRQKVQQSLLAAVPFKRRVSRAKKGMWNLHGNTGLLINSTQT